MHTLQKMYTLHKILSHGAQMMPTTSQCGGITIILVLQKRKQAQVGCGPSSATKQLIPLNATQAFQALAVQCRPWPHTTIILSCHPLTDQDQIHRHLFRTQQTNHEENRSQTPLSRLTIFYLFIYLFLAALGLRCCARASLAAASGSYSLRSTTREATPTRSPCTTAKNKFFN